MVWCLVHLAGYWYLRKHNIDFWAFADIFAPALILAQSVGRMANLFNGDAFGHPTGGNFGILYPESTLAYRTYGNQPLWPAEIWGRPNRYSNLRNLTTL